MFHHTLIVSSDCSRILFSLYEPHANEKSVCNMLDIFWLKGIVDRISKHICYFSVTWSINNVTVGYAWLSDICMLLFLLYFINEQKKLGINRLYYLLTREKNCKAKSFSFCRITLNAYFYLTSLRRYYSRFHSSL